MYQSGVDRVTRPPNDGGDQAANVYHRLRPATASDAPRNATYIQIDLEFHLMHFGTIEPGLS